MSLHMCKIATVLACLMCSGHGRRVQASIRPPHSQPLAKNQQPSKHADVDLGLQALVELNETSSHERAKGVPTPLKALKRLALAFAPTSAFNPAARQAPATHFTLRDSILPPSRPIVTDRQKRHRQRGPVMEAPDWSEDSPHDLRLRLERTWTQSLKQQQNTEMYPLKEQAMQLTRQMYGPEDPKTLATLTQYAVKLGELGHYAEAEPLMKEALELERKVNGPKHPDTIAALIRHADALGFLGRHTEAALLKKELVDLMREEFRFFNRSDTLSEILHGTPGVENYGEALTSYAQTLSELGREVEAQELLAEAYRLTKRVYGQHPETLIALNNLAVSMTKLGRHDEAEPLNEELHKQSHELLGEVHSFTVKALCSYASTLRSLGRAHEAEPLIKVMQEVAHRVLGPSHPDTLKVQSDYALTLLTLGRDYEAEPLLKEVFEITQRIYGDSNPDTLVAFNNYAEAVLESDSGEPEPLLKEALDLTRQVYGPDHLATLQALSNYANLLFALGRDSEAQRPIHQLFDRAYRVLGPQNPITLTALNDYVKTLRKFGKDIVAASTQKPVLDVLRSRLPRGSPQLLKLVVDYADTLSRLGRHAEAEPLIQEAAEIIDIEFDSWITDMEFDSGQHDRLSAVKQYVARLGKASSSSEADLWKEAEILRQS